MNEIYKADLSRILELPYPWQKLKNANILITGATGLIGQCLVDALLLLDEKYGLNLHLFLISRSKIKSQNSKITNIAHDVSKDFGDDIFVNNRFDFIIHLASNTHPIQYSTEPISTITTNFFGTYNLLNLAKNNKNSRFLFLSSVEIYGSAQNGRSVKWSEKDCEYIDCNTMRAGYPEAKRVCESLCCAFAKEYSVDFVTARLCRSYGPTLKKDDSKALSQFIFKAVNNEDIVLKSSGTQVFSYIYSVDAAGALLCILLNGQSGQAYNIADEKSDISLKDAAQICADMAGTKVIFDLPNETEKSGFSNANIAILDSTKLQSLGWKALVDIKTGLENTIKILKNM